MTVSKSVILLFVSALAQALAPATGSAQPSAISLFPYDTVREVILTTDMRALFRHKYDEQEQAAILQIVRLPGDTARYDVEIRCRGNIRKEVCYYPSIRVKFPKKDFSYHKLKWVNVCNSDDDEENLFQEYLAYRMYDRIADVSFGASLIRVHYLDSEGKEKPLRSYAIILQNADELAGECGGRVHEPAVMKESLLDRDYLALFTFFEYMIGNTDWAFGNRHNVEVVTHKALNSLIPVPYDFDYSGFVNAKYAVPHESIPIPHVTVRYNKSVCLDEALCEKTRLLFLEKKEEILGTCSTFGLLDEKSRSKAMNYLEDFFKLLEDPRDTYRVFVKDCRQIR
jgi:hypothetical protein